MHGAASRENKKMKRTLGLALAILVLGGVSARANDGYAGIGVSGLEFGDSDAIAMERT